MDREEPMSDPGPKSHSIWWLYLLVVTALLPGRFGGDLRTVAALAAGLTFLFSLHGRTESAARLPLAAIALWVGIDQGRASCVDDSCWWSLTQVLFLSLCAAVVGYGYLPEESRGFGLLLLQSAGLSWNGFLIGRQPVLGVTLFAVFVGVLLLLKSVADSD
jgi:hypothetical protein